MTHEPDPRPIQKRRNSVMFRTCTSCGDTLRTRTDFRWMVSKGTYHPWCLTCEREANAQRRRRRAAAD